MIFLIFFLFPPFDLIYQRFKDSNIHLFSFLSLSLFLSSLTCTLHVIVFLAFLNNISLVLTTAKSITIRWHAFFHLVLAIESLLFGVLLFFIERNCKSKDELKNCKIHIYISIHVSIRFSNNIWTKVNNLFWKNIRLIKFYIPVQ